MSDNSCPPDHAWTPLLAGEPPSQDLAEHLAACANCRERVQVLREELAELRSLSGPNETPPPPTRLPRPAMIGKYLVVGEFQGGGQSRVYRAVHPTLDRELVIKVSGPLCGGFDARALLVAEGKLLAALDHPNLARVYDLDFHGEAPFLVMEYVRGPTLQDWSGGRPVPPRRAADLVLRIARALAVAHRRGIIHQDVKPSNIVMGPDEEPRLIDFGLARLRHAWDDGPQSPSGGTPAFMAPEQARGETARIGPASDVFALGGVLYFLLSGKVPFPGTAEEALQRARRCDFDRGALAKVPRRLRDICLRAMAEDPAGRYTDAMALATDLEQFQRHSRRVFLAAGGVLAAGLVAAAWLAFRPGPATPTAAAELASLEVQVVRDGRYTDLAHALPLSTQGDRLRVVGRVPAGLEPVLYSVGPRGRAERLEVDLSPGDTFTRVVFPAGGGNVPFDANSSGTELLLLCAGKAPSARDDLGPMLESVVGSLPPLPGDMIIRLDRLEPHRQTGSSLGPRETDPVADAEYRLDRLRQRLRDRFEVILGVAFSHTP
jgi:predicted Ser/Thr protein kinase